MVMPFKCPFCEETYGDAEVHYCSERQEWEDDLIKNGKEALKTLKNFVDPINKDTQRWWKWLEDARKKGHI